VTKETGKLVRWDDVKGYGFIQPKKGGDDLFLHINEMPHNQRRPLENDLIAYESATDAKGRLRAINAKLVGQCWSRFTIIWMVSVLLFAVYVCCVLAHILQFHPLAVYALMSILTVHQYSIDKAEARAGRWRTSEANLHFFELAGGWPGALFAQYFYRHKYRKLPYQIVFWGIVLIHGISWSWIVSHPDTVNEIKNALLLHVQASADTDRLHYSEHESDQRPQSQDVMYSHTRQYGLESRARIIVKNDRRIIEGIIAEVNPLVGIVVALPAQFEGVGVIERYWLNPGFTNEFFKGEPIHVDIKSISMKGSSKQINLDLVEK
jgi:uncharacterized membrane protein YsdA (DUF1294 family)/cold shock CspA family protein